MTTKKAALAITLLLGAATARPVAILSAAGPRAAAQTPPAPAPAGSRR